MINQMEIKKKLLEQLMGMMGGMDGEKLPKKGLSLVEIEVEKDEEENPMEEMGEDFDDEMLKNKILEIIKKKRMAA